MKTSTMTALALLVALAALLGADGPRRTPWRDRQGKTPAPGAAAAAKPGAARAEGKAPAGLTVFESPAVLTGDCEIDRLVLARLQKLGIQPSNLCSDAVFVRRAYLDVIGTLPTAQEAREFIRDDSPTKRRALIDKLLERDEYADYWSLKWSDVLRVKAEFPINLWPNAVQAYHRWIRTSLKENKPYDQFARELLTSSGSNFRVGPVNFYRAMQNHEPDGIAQAVALTFMGSRIETWPKERANGLAGFFEKVGFKATGEWKEEIVFFDPNRQPAAPAAGKKGAKPIATAPAVPRQPVFPDGTPARLSADQDPREAFANWLLDPKNPYFAKAMANRAWAWLVGRGIVHEPDDMRPDNPPANPELLAYLEKELVSSKYDLKHLMRVILNSKTYQLSSVPKSRHVDAEANFAWYPIRRLEAEVLADALCQITGSTEKYTSPIPEPFTFIPEDQRSIALADGSTTSSFLEMFGRPPRDTGLESERNNRPTADQRLHMLNSSHIQRKLEQSRKLSNLASQSKNGPREMATAFYLTILSRFPTDEELKAVSAFGQSSNLKSREVPVDLAWALINSAEFMYRH